MLYLVFVVKYRRKVFDDKISERAKEIFEYIAAPHYNTTLQEWNHDINAYKSASSRLLKKEFPQIRQKLWKHRGKKTSEKRGEKHGKQSI